MFSSSTRRRYLVAGVLVGLAASAAIQSQPSAEVQVPRPEIGDEVSITAVDCTAARIGTSIPNEKIGEPVRRVTLAEPQWVAETTTSPALCRVSGVIEPVDTSSTARPINFAVALPQTWMRRAVQLGGGGMNGTIPNLAGGGGPGSASLATRGVATYGSDSGHQIGGFGGPGARGGPRGGGAPAGPQPPSPAAPAPVGPTAAPTSAPAGPVVAPAAPAAAPAAPAAAGAPSRGIPAPPASANEWAINDEAIANLGYMQMKKTHDAAMVVMERLYGARPRFNYYIGSSQGGREALTVAQRYPADYDGIAANVPILSFSTLMLAPELIRIHEKPLANWVTAAKVNAIRGEFMRQCDGLDGLADGIINNYRACRAIFDVTEGARGRHPWAAKRCPNNVDPDPSDTTGNACLTDGQISTLEFTYSRYLFAAPLANGTKTFGMWVPNTDPSGSGLIVNARFRGQEGAADSAPMHSHLGVLGVTGFLMRNLSANPLDYAEGGALQKRREELSRIVDGTNPDLGAFLKRGGKMIVTIGTNDTLASPGAQLDYYQAVLDKMGRASVDRFARLYVMPQTGHGLSGTIYNVSGTGASVTSAPIPNRYDQQGLLFDWVEKQTPPPMAPVVSAGDRSLPLCSYPTYPRYVQGPPESASSYRCSE